MPRFLNIYQVNFVCNEPKARNRVTLGTEQGFFFGNFMISFEKIKDYNLSTL